MKILLWYEGNLAYDIFGEVWDPQIEIFDRNVLLLSRISMYRGTKQTSRYSFTGWKEHFKYLLQSLEDKRKAFFQTNFHQSLRAHNDCYPRPWGTLDQASNLVMSHPHRRHTPRSVRQLRLIPYSRLILRGFYQYWSPHTTSVRIYILSIIS